MTRPFDPAPTSLAAVVDPQWLSAMLSHRWPGTDVVGVEIVETLVTQATKVRLSLTFTKSSHPDVPAAVCIKGILVPTQVTGTASVVETRFYRDCATRQPVRVPQCYYAALNQAGDNGVIVMRDEIAAGGQFLSALTPFTPDGARQTLDQLAQLHAAAWLDRSLLEPAWIPRFLDQIGSKPIMPLDRLQGLLDGQKALRLPNHLKDAKRLQSGVAALASQIRDYPAFLVHGDAHAGNIFRDSTGFGLVDWQILQKGDWAQDVAYHLAAVLSPDDRRAHERGLIDYYLDRLAALGGPFPEARRGLETLSCRHALRVFPVGDHPTGGSGDHRSFYLPTGHRRRRPGKFCRSRSLSYACPSVRTPCEVATIDNVILLSIKSDKPTCAFAILPRTAIGSPSRP